MIELTWLPSNENPTYMNAIEHKIVAASNLAGKCLDNTGARSITTNAVATAEIISIILCDFENINLA